MTTKDQALAPTMPTVVLDVRHAVYREDGAATTPGNVVSL